MHIQPAYLSDGSDAPRVVPGYGFRYGRRDERSAEGINRGI